MGLISLGEDAALTAVGAGPLVMVRRAFASVPRWAWEALAAIAALFAVWHWHASKVRDATHAGVVAGMDAQLAADGRAVLKAFVAANAEQQALVDQLKPKQATISKGTTDGLVSNSAGVDRDLADYRVRHGASAAPAGRAVADGPVAFPDAPGGDHVAPAQVGLVVGVEAEAIADAAKDSAQLAACSAWIGQQQAAWPK